MEWKPLSLNDKPILDDALRRHPLSLSDYSFTNLWMWNVARNYQIANADNFLCIKFTQNGQNLYLYPLGQGSRKAVVQKLMANETPFQMRAVPEEGVADLKDLPLTIVEETDHFDYIYAYDDLVHLHGDHFQPKRNFIHQFEGLYNYEFKMMDPALITQAIETEKRWFTEHPERADSMATEHNAVLRALEAFSELKIEGGALFVEEKMIAFTLAEYLTPEMLVIHVEKALNGYKGAYAMINQQMLKHLAPVPYVNREEDLGLDNLTKVKQSYHPVRLEKKYLVQGPDCYHAMDD